MRLPPRAALAALLLAVSAAATAVVALLGPSAAVAPLGRTGSADPWLVTGLLAGATVSGTAGVLLGLRSRPSARLLLAGGLLTSAGLAALAPVGSADVLSYLAYGKATATHADPYAALPRQVLPEVEDPWRDTPSVYGPLATAEQGLAWRAGGGSTRAALGWLAAANALAFAGVGLALHRWTADPVRAHLLWTANPLLLLQLVAGVHLDVLLAVTVLPAVVLAARRPVLAGLALGAGVAVKATGGLPALGLALARRTRPVALLGLALPALALAGTAYATAGPHVFDQLRRASRFTSVASPWRPVRAALGALIGAGPAQTAVAGGALALAVALGVRLGRRLPAGTADPRWALVVSASYLLAAPYQLAWYDALALALLPLLAPSRLDLVIVGHLGVLTLAYLPGRVVGLPAALHTVTDVLRAGVGPAALAVLVAAAWFATHPGGEDRRSPGLRVRPVS